MGFACCVARINLLRTPPASNGCLMRKNGLNIVLFLVFAAGLTSLFLYADKHWIKRRKSRSSRRRK